MSATRLAARLPALVDAMLDGSRRALAQLISLIEDDAAAAAQSMTRLHPQCAIVLPG